MPKMGGGGKGWKASFFDNLKNFQFACSRLNILYLSHGAVSNMPTSRSWRKENWGYRVVAGSNRKPQAF